MTDKGTNNKQTTCIFSVSRGRVRMDPYRIGSVVVRLILCCVLAMLVLDCASALKGPEGEVHARFKNAENLLKRQKFEEATEEYREIVKNHPESKYADDAYFKLGYIHCIIEEYQLADTYFNIILDKYPSSNWVFDAGTWANLTGEILSCDEKVTIVHEKPRTSSGTSTNPDEKLVGKVDELKQENKELRERIEELERLIGELE